MNPYIDPLASVKSRHIGRDTTVWQYVVILEKARIGEGCNINCHCFIENDVSLGNNVTVKCGVYLWDGITVEDGVFIGPNVTFTNDLYPRSRRRPAEFSRTLVREGASIGANATIIAGITIGKHSLIGAGSVVTKDVPDHALAYGNPARVHGHVCRCGNRLDAELRCALCGSSCILEGGVLGEKR